MKARKCPEGHPIKGWNVSWYSYRGKPAKRCRICKNKYQRRLMRKRRHAGKP